MGFLLFIGYPGCAMGGPGQENEEYKKKDRERWDWVRELPDDKLILRAEDYARKVNDHCSEGPLSLSEIDRSAGKDEAILTRLLGEMRRRIGEPSEDVRPMAMDRDPFAEAMAQPDYRAESEGLFYTRREG
jgi:hypothetical protein